MLKRALQAPGAWEALAFRTPVLLQTRMVARPALRTTPILAVNSATRIIGSRPHSTFLASRPKSSFALPVDDDVHSPFPMHGQASNPITKTVLLDRGDPEKKRQEILRYFHQTYDKYDELFDVLSSEASFFERAEPLRHPLIFYYGHTAVLYINKLIMAKVLDKHVDFKLESMLAVGVDEMSWDDLNDAHYDWPTSGEVREYRRIVRELVTDLIQTQPLQMPINWDNHFWWAIMMGIEHENIHLETSSVIMRRLPMEFVKAQHPSWPICPNIHQPAPQNTLVPVDGKSMVLGKSRDNPIYGWDNEYGARAVDVQDFKASKFLVSNAEFLEFVKAGGYDSPQWWDEEGRRWLEYSEAQHPLWWLPQADSSFGMRTLVEELPEMPWSWPVEVNWLEAKAYCNWLGASTGRSLRLPSEEEWTTMRQLVSTDQPYWPQGEAPGNINLEYFASSCPVDQFEWGNTGLYDVIGNVWQWTETPIDGFDGYQVHPLYDDFSNPTFDGKHTVFKGGSWISVGCNGATQDSRYAFRRHFFQHAGFRYVESPHAVDMTMRTFETDPVCAAALHAHYAPELLGQSNFWSAVARLCLAHNESCPTGKPRGRALNVGSGAGRLALELGKGFEEVVGVDQTMRVVKNAVQLIHEGSVRYSLAQEGDIMDVHEVSLAKMGLADTPGMVTFWQADACNLDPLKIGTDYNLVVASELVHRLHDPRAFLASIHNFITPGGHLVLTSDCNWSEETTPRANWLGGYRHAGTNENVSTLAGITAVLQDRFQMVGVPQDMVLVQQHSERSFQHSLSQVTVWQKKL